jgi:two-component system, OmpR family, sensor histidine kinase KdpD
MARFLRIDQGSRPLAGHAAALGAVAVVTCVIALIDARVHLGNVSMLYLVAVIGVAVYFGQGPAILASVAAFLAFDFFFIDPRHRFTVSDPAEWVALLLFLTTAIITGQLAARQRLRAKEAESREREAALLYDVTRLLSNDDTRAALEAVASRIQIELSLAAIGIEVEGQDSRTRVQVEVGEPQALRVVRSSRLAPFQVLNEGATPTATQA